MGRHYNRTKAHPSSRPGNDHKSPGHQKVDREFRTTSEKLAADYGVSDLTIQRAGKFAAAVETLRAVDPERPATTATRTDGVPEPGIRPEGLKDAKFLTQGVRRSWRSWRPSA